LIILAEKEYMHFLSKIRSLSNKVHSINGLTFDVITFLGSERIIPLGFNLTLELIVYLCHRINFMCQINNASFIITYHNISVVCMFLFFILSKELSEHFISFWRLPPFETLRPYFEWYGVFCFSQILTYAILVFPMTGKRKYQEAESLRPCRILEVDRFYLKYSE
jgi:hypothetical protein